MNATKQQTLAGLVEDLENNVRWCKDMSHDDLEFAFNTTTRVVALLADIGLPADRKYTVSEIDRLKTAIEWALEGNE